MNFVVFDIWGKNHYVHTSVDLTYLGNTSILRTGDIDGHWHATGGAITLAELLMAFGRSCTVSEIMFWYHHADKLVRKRPHAWGSEIVRQAAGAREIHFGRRGHPD